MKTMIIVAVLILILALFFFWLFFFSSRAETNLQNPDDGSQNLGQSKSSAGSTDWGDYKDLLFVDQSLDELVNKYNLPDDSFVSAFRNIRNAKPKEAKENLKQVLADHTPEVRTRLWAWKALRQLGETPSPGIRDEVQGVVLEVPVNNWVDTLAAYSDGRARYLNGKGGVIIWETPEDPGMRPLVINLVKSAKSLVQNTPAVEKHLPAKQSVIRVSILTYGGIHILEASESEITNKKDHIMAPVYNSGTKLLLALLDWNNKANQKQ